MRPLACLLTKPARIFLRCDGCDHEFDLPKDGTIKSKGVLALPLHFRDGRLAESDAQPDVCCCSHSLASILRAYD